jgi:hypothetical protein
MNAATLVMVPLRATVLSTRWTTVVVLSLMLAVSVSLQWVQRQPQTSLIASVISGYGEFFVGLLFVAPFLLMAIDTRQLRIPRSQSTVIFSMLLYSTLWIAVPSMALALAGADFVTALSIQTVGLLFGLTFGLLPRAFLIVAGFAPSFLGLANIRWHYPGQPTILVLWLAAAVLALISAMSWRRQVRLSDPYGEGFNKPLVLRSRASNRTGVTSWNDWTAWSGSSPQIRSQPQWMLPRADVRDTGPQNRVRSLRVWLGGWTLPKTWQSASRQWLFVLVPIFVMMALVYLRAPATMTGLFHAIAFSAVVWMTGFGSILLGMITVTTLQQRWSRTNTELPLLALLPGLGDGSSAKKLLLRAGLLPTLFWQVVFIALLLATSFLMHASALNIAIGALIQIVAIAFAPAFALAVLGGLPPAQWVAGLVAGIGFALVGCGTAASSLLEASRSYGSIMAISIITIWLAMLMFLIWLGARGWRALQARPHPFLAN